MKVLVPAIEAGECAFDLSAKWLRTYRAKWRFDPFREQLALAAKVDASLGFFVAMDAARGVEHAA
jgi:hypothetical protein